MHPPKPISDQTTLAPRRESPPISIPRQIGRYQVREILGRGGMGVVYLAWDEQLQREVAIKVLTDAAFASADVLARFRLESRSIAGVKHQNIAEIYEAGEEEGRPFLVMEFLPNGTLAERIKDQPLAAADAARYLETLARAVHAAHQSGVIHRDLKPSNVLFDRNDTLKITDFGLAKRIGSDEHATVTGQILGTPAYMAPEQAGGVVKNVGPTCDVYALGAILYEMLCGHPPFQSPDPMEAILLVLTTEPVSLVRLQPRLKRDLATICHKCLEKTPSRRYATALELAEDLARFRDGFAIHARPVSRIEKLWRWAKRHPTGAALIVVSAVALTAMLIGGAWYNRRLQRELDRSNQVVADGRDFAQWVLGEHMASVSTLAGATEVQAKLVTELLAYLDGLASHASSDDPLIATIARAYLRIAQVQGGPDGFNLGDTAGALTSAEKAEQLYRRAVAAAPNDAELKLGEFNCRRTIIQLRRVIGKEKVPGAGEASREGIETIRNELGPLVSQVADEDRVRMLDILLRSDLAWIDLEEGKLDEAESKMAGAHSAARVISKRHPLDVQHQRTLRTLENDLTQILERKGQYSAALVYTQSLVDRSHADIKESATNAMFRQQLATDLVRHGDTLAYLHRDEDMLVAYREAEKIRRELLAVDAKNAKLKSGLVSVLDRIAAALQSFQKFGEAKSVLLEAISLNDELLASDSQSIDVRRTAWILKNSLGNSLTMLGEHQQAIDALKAALSMEESLVGQDASRISDLNGIAETCDILSRSYFNRAVATMSESDLQEAVKFSDRSLEAYKKLESASQLSASQSSRKQAVTRSRELLNQAIQATKPVPTK